MEKRAAYETGLDATLADLLEEDEAAGQVEATRKRPRYRSEDQRVKLSLDVDLEPCVGEVIRRLAANPPAVYGEGPIRTGDLATAALVIGLVAIDGQQAGIEAEWTNRSRGARNVGLVQKLDEEWDRIVLGLGVERF